MKRGHSLLEILVAITIIVIVFALIGMALVKLKKVVRSLGGQGTATIAARGDGAGTHRCAETNRWPGHQA